jgi:hypothetical protein
MKATIEAAVIPAICSDSHQPFGIRVQKAGPETWDLTWAFAVTAARSRKEGYAEQQLQGNFRILESYPGCPHCKQRRRLFACQCPGTPLSCHDGGPTATCPACKRTVTTGGRVTELAANSDHT